MRPIKQRLITAFTPRVLLEAKPEKSKPEKPEAADDSLRVGTAQPKSRHVDKPASPAEIAARAAARNDQQEPPGLWVTVTTLKKKDASAFCKALASFGADLEEVAAYFAKSHGTDAAVRWLLKLGPQTDRKKLKERIASRAEVLTLAHGAKLAPLPRASDLTALAKKYDEAASAYAAAERAKKAQPDDLQVDAKLKQARVEWLAVDGEVRGKFALMHAYMTLPEVDDIERQALAKLNDVLAWPTATTAAVHVFTSVMPANALDAKPLSGWLSHPDVNVKPQSLMHFAVSSEEPPELPPDLAATFDTFKQQGDYPWRHVVREAWALRVDFLQKKAETESDSNGPVHTALAKAKAALAALPQTARLIRENYAGLVERGTRALIARSPDSEASSKRIARRRDAVIAIYEELASADEKSGAKKRANQVRRKQAKVTLQRGLDALRRGTLPEDFDAVDKLYQKIEANDPSVIGTREHTKDLRAMYATRSQAAEAVWSADMERFISAARKQRETNGQDPVAPDAGLLHLALSDKKRQAEVDDLRLQKLETIAPSKRTAIDKAEHQALSEERVLLAAEPARIRLEAEKANVVRASAEKARAAVGQPRPPVLLDEVHDMVGLDAQQKAAAHAENARRIAAWMDKGESSLPVVIEKPDFEALDWRARGKAMAVHESLLAQQARGGVVGTYSPRPVVLSDNDIARLPKQQALAAAKARDEQLAAWRSDPANSPERVAFDDERYDVEQRYHDAIDAQTMAAARRNAVERVFGTDTQTTEQLVENGRKTLQRSAAYANADGAAQTTDVFDFAASEAQARYEALAGDLFAIAKQTASHRVRLAEERIADVKQVQAAHAEALAAAKHHAGLIQEQAARTGRIKGEDSRIAPPSDHVYLDEKLQPTTATLATYAFSAKDHLEFASLNAAKAQADSDGAAAAVDKRNASAAEEVAGREALAATEHAYTFVAQASMQRAKLGEDKSVSADDKRALDSDYVRLATTVATSGFSHDAHAGSDGVFGKRGVRLLQEALAINDARLRAANDEQLALQNESYALITTAAWQGRTQLGAGETTRVQQLALHALTRLTYEALFKFDAKRAQAPTAAELALAGPHGNALRADVEKWRFSERVNAAAIAERGLDAAARDRVQTDSEMSEAIGDNLDAIEGSAGPVTTYVTSTLYSLFWSDADFEWTNVKDAAKEAALERLAPAVDAVADQKEIAYHPERGAYNEYVFGYEMLEMLSQYGKGRAGQVPDEAAEYGLMGLMRDGSVDKKPERFAAEAFKLVTRYFRANPAAWKQECKQWYQDHPEDRADPEGAAKRIIARRLRGLERVARFDPVISDFRKSARSPDTSALAYEYQRPDRPSLYEPERRWFAQLNREESELWAKSLGSTRMRLTNLFVETSSAFLGGGALVRLLAGATTVGRTTQSVNAALDLRYGFAGRLLYNAAEAATGVGISFAAPHAADALGLEGGAREAFLFVSGLLSMGAIGSSAKFKFMTGSSELAKATEAATILAVSAIPEVAMAANVSQERAHQLGMATNLLVMPWIGAYNARAALPNARAQAARIASHLPAAHRRAAVEVLHKPMLVDSNMSFAPTPASLSARRRRLQQALDAHPLFKDNDALQKEVLDRDAVSWVIAAHPAEAPQDPSQMAAFVLKQQQTLATALQAMGYTNKHTDPASGRTITEGQRLALQEVTLIYRDSIVEADRWYARHKPAERQAFRDTFGLGPVRTVSNATPTDLATGLENTRLAGELVGEPIFAAFVQPDPDSCTLVSMLLVKALKTPGEPERIRELLKTEAGRRALEAELATAIQTHRDAIKALNGDDSDGAFAADGGLTVREAEQLSTLVGEELVFVPVELQGERSALKLIDGLSQPPSVFVMRRGKANHVAVLLGKTAGGYEVYDPTPGEGFKVLSREQLAAQVMYVAAPKAQAPAFSRDVVPYHLRDGNGVAYEGEPLLGSPIDSGPRASPPPFSERAQAYAAQLERLGGQRDALSESLHPIVGRPVSVALLEHVLQPPWVGSRAKIVKTESLAEGGIEITAELYDADGTKIGSTKRRLRREDGHFVLELDKLDVEPRYEQTDLREQLAQQADAFFAWATERDPGASIRGLNFGADAYVAAKNQDFAEPGEAVKKLAQLERFLKRKEQSDNPPFTHARVVAVLDRAKARMHVAGTLSPEYFATLTLASHNEEQTLLARGQHLGQAFLLDANTTPWIGVRRPFALPSTKRPIPPPTGRVSVQDDGARAEVTTALNAYQARYGVHPDAEAQRAWVELVRQDLALFSNSAETRAQMTEFAALAATDPAFRARYEAYQSLPVQVTKEGGLPLMAHVFFAESIDSVQKLAGVIAENPKRAADILKVLGTVYQHSIDHLQTFQDALHPGPLMRPAEVAYQHQRADGFRRMHEAMLRHLLASDVVPAAFSPDQLEPLLDVALGRSNLGLGDPAGLARVLSGTRTKELEVVTRWITKGGEFQPDVLITELNGFRFGLRRDPPARHDVAPFRPFDERAFAERLDASENLVNSDTSLPPVLAARVEKIFGRKITRAQLELSAQPPDGDVRAELVRMEALDNEGLEMELFLRDKEGRLVGRVIHRASRQPSDKPGQTYLDWHSPLMQTTPEYQSAGLDQLLVKQLHAFVAHATDFEPGIRVTIGASREDVTPSNDRVAASSDKTTVRGDEVVTRPAIRPPSAPQAPISPPQPARPVARHVVRVQRHDPALEARIRQYYPNGYPELAAALYPLDAAKREPILKAIERSGPADFDGALIKLAQAPWYAAARGTAVEHMVACVVSLGRKSHAQQPAIAFVAQQTLRTLWERGHDAQAQQQFDLPADAVWGGRNDNLLAKWAFISEHATPAGTVERLQQIYHYELAGHFAGGHMPRTEWAWRTLQLELRDITALQRGGSEAEAIVDWVDTLGFFPPTVGTREQRLQQLNDRVHGDRWYPWFLQDGARAAPTAGFSWKGISPASNDAPPPQPLRHVEALRNAAYPPRLDIEQQMVSVTAGYHAAATNNKDAQMVQALKRLAELRAALRAADAQAKALLNAPPLARGKEAVLAELQQRAQHHGSGAVRDTAVATLEAMHAHPDAVKWKESTTAGAAAEQIYRATHPAKTMLERAAQEWNAAVVHARANGEAISMRAAWERVQQLVITESGGRVTDEVLAVYRFFGERDMFGSLRHPSKNMIKRLWTYPEVSPLLVYPQDPAQAVSTLATPASLERARTQLKPPIAAHTRALITEALRDPDVTIVTTMPLEEGVNTSRIVLLSNGMKAVWKPSAGENMAVYRGNIEQDHQGRREAATALIEEAMGGFADPPPTVYRTLNGEAGALMAFIDGETAAQAGSIAAAAVPKLEVFDYVIGNLDRHTGNVMANGVPIDHGLILPVQNGPQGDANIEFASQRAMTPKELAAVQKLMNNRDELTAALLELDIDPRAIDAMYERVTWMLESGGMHRRWNE